MIEYQTEYPSKTEEITEALEDFVTSTIMPQWHKRWSFDGTVEPGDGTHYEIFGVLKGKVGGQELWWIGFMSGDYRGRSAVLPMEFWLNWGYVQEKMNFENTHTTRILTDILNLIIHFKEGLNG